MSRKFNAPFIVIVGIVGMAPAFLKAAEVTVQNDSLVPPGVGAIQAGFIAGESAASWLTSPCTGDIVAVQVFWRSVTGGTGQSLEDSITVFAGGTFPTPGSQLALLEGPVMTDGVINEFRFLDDQMTIPLNIPVNSGQVFIVSFRFFNNPDPDNGPSVVTDTGCQNGKNALFAIPGGWLNSCALGVSGDWVIRAVVDCAGACCLNSGGCQGGQTSAECAQLGGTFQGNGTTCGPTTCPEPTQACCFMPSGCLDFSVADCGTAGGFPQGPGTSCATVVCFPRGACCQPDGTCDDDVAEADCEAGGGTFQGDDSTCAGVSCPQPTGACCLSNGNCLVLTEADCGVIPNSVWAGAFTNCADGNGNGTADDCELECFDDGDCDDEDPCTQDTCAGGSCDHTPISRPFGDIAPQPDGDGNVDVADVLCVLDGFGDAALCPGGDLAPCAGDGNIDVGDVLAVLDAFAGTSSCPDPC